MSGSRNIPLALPSIPVGRSQVTQYRVPQGPGQRTQNFVMQPQLRAPPLQQVPASQSGSAPPSPAQDWAPPLTRPLWIAPSWARPAIPPAPTPYPTAQSCAPRGTGLPQAAQGHVIARQGRGMIPGLGLRGPAPAFHQRPTLPGDAPGLPRGHAGEAGLRSTQEQQETPGTPESLSSAEFDAMCLFYLGDSPPLQQQVPASQSGRAPPRPAQDQAPPLTRPLYRITPPWVPPAIPPAPTPYPIAPSWPPRGTGLPQAARGHVIARQGRGMIPGFGPRGPAPAFLQRPILSGDAPAPPQGHASFSPLPEAPPP
eukprot:jgi/Botrbrau1/5612/Bobra.55_1s0001.1